MLETMCLKIQSSQNELDKFIIVETIFKTHVSETDLLIEQSLTLNMEDLKTKLTSWSKYLSSWSQREFHQLSKNECHVLELEVDLN